MWPEYTPLSFNYTSDLIIHTVFFSERKVSSIDDWGHQYTQSDPC